MSQFLISLPEAQRLRDRHYRRKPNLRLKNAAEIRKFVDEVQLCFLFPVQGLEMPSLYQAVCGRDADTDTTLRDANIGLTWNTKDQALDKRWWYYGKLIRSKATMISLSLMPSLYALSQNFGDLEDYLQEYEEGTLSADAKNIYEALLREGPMHAIALKRKVNLYGDEVKGKFDRAINELQTGLKILPVGVAEAGAWRYAFIYELFPRWFPQIPLAARELSRHEARVRILDVYLGNVIFATAKEVTRLFGWKKTEVDAAIKSLVDTNHAAFGNVVKGVDDEVLLSRTAVS